MERTVKRKWLCLIGWHKYRRTEQEETISIDGDTVTMIVTEFMRCERCQYIDPVSFHKFPYRYSQAAEEAKNGNN